MRTMLRVHIPAKLGNRASQEGTLDKKVGAFIEKFKPEAAYFFPDGGKRSALFVFDMPDSSHIPSVAEHFFFDLEAEVSLTPVMNAEELKAGLKRSKQLQG